MAFLDNHLNAPLLTADEEVRLARRIEAGVYAEHLLATERAGDVALVAVRDDGRDAWQELWTANLRLVRRHAMDFAKRQSLPVDDLFQDGCIGLADAMQRFDHGRGLRFTTLAHDYVRHAVAASAARRGGMLEGPLHRQRIRQRIRRAEADGGRVGRRELADLVGASPLAVEIARGHTASIDEVPSAQVVFVDDFDRVERVGTDFLNLLSTEAAEFLRLRFGIGRPTHSLRQLAARLSISESTARRLEAVALELARRVLAGDDERCVLPSETELDPTMQALGPRLLALAAA
ncbi:sigma-70 family RNA polymerase sigma factor [Tessaracoccus rhinocerotis]|uniref:Sigma-70 family RNA polymerase sigma factor n=1 Tax=Tessaracoccus rhinocerotis TaxID=1689449 RepID=A0A553K6D3_9ACTN|nr:sigma-70 family RNA polymerase sigma factor [Tessaracoccus rhinocerotis]TRY20269.1 sigma-70 family RNA polymerase sigma factor [Tessaracoccus rhinocerotis]